MAITRRAFFLFSMVTLFFTSGCNYSSNQPDTAQLWGILGAGIYDSVKSSPVQFYQVKHELPKSSNMEYTAASDRIELTEEQKLQLKNLLLDDKHYVFDAQKKCIFIPETAFAFTNSENEVLALVSLNCKQIQFVLNKQNKILDFDPMADEFGTFIKSLMSPSMKANYL